MSPELSGARRTRRRSMRVARGKVEQRRGLLSERPLAGGPSRSHEGPSEEDPGAAHSPTGDRTRNAPIDAYRAAALRSSVRVSRFFSRTALTAGTPEPRTSLSKAGTSVFAIARHFASCVSTRFERSSKTSYIAFVGAKSALPTASARPPILRFSLAG